MKYNHMNNLVISLLIVVNILNSTFCSDYFLGTVLSGTILSGNISLFGTLLSGTVFVLSTVRHDHIDK